MPDPVNTVPPAVTGTSTVGLTLHCDTGTWTNSPTSYGYQWQLETAVGSGIYANISAATANIYRLIDADIGLRLRCVVTASNTAFPGPWLGWTVPAVPGGATVVATANQLLTLLRSPVANTNYDATGLTTNFTDRVIIDGVCPNGQQATFWLGTNVKFLRASLNTDPSVDIVGAQNMTIYGGNITNDRGAGMVNRPYITSNRQLKTFKWWDFYVHDTAGGGIGCHQENSLDIDGLDLRGEVTNWSTNLAYDPHNYKGSGLHGAYLGETKTNGYVRNSTFVLHIHDGPYGGGCQLGPGLVSTEVQVQAERLMYNPPVGADGTGGNAVQIFGDNQANLVVSYVECDTVRRGVEVSGLGTPALPIQVTHGRVTNYRLSKYDTSKPDKIIYTDCS